MNHYEVLGLSASADAVVIKAAYRALSQCCHPDKCRPSERDAAHQRMTDLNAAYRVLGETFSRRQYDEGLAKGPRDRRSTFSTVGEPGAPATSGGSRLPLRLAILFISVLLAFALGVDKKPWWQWSWELVSGGFDQPSHYVVDWPVFVITLGIGLWLASLARRRS
ncbi:MAG: DnaJ domain-containing protein [Methylibium sp.]|uniref:J domain-containing protein n=1 Tax=Methylibium sp. TaxID=2067992 RepID=UPI00184F26F4|nr:J domain-containing protein [Methylibium sp.]MBA3589519.1 DnaJ domain-containing protein [Methylibium sp.]MBA3623569.1 DnaJ domain-containing protein [Methylibium sp.]